MIHTDKVIVVEGKYDRIKLAGITDAPVITTEGFGIFKDKEKQELLVRLAEKRGLIILTDSDSAGFMIRNFLGSRVPQERITNVYIPDLYGKEKRKGKPSAEGKLGVEGVSESVIREAFLRAGVGAPENGAGQRAAGKPRREITNLDFYDDGISGGPESKNRRAALKKALGLPERLSSTGLLKVINILVDYDEYKKLVSAL